MINVDTCKYILKRYGEIIGVIPEAEDLYSQALWDLEKLGLSPEEVEDIRVSAIVNPHQRDLAQRLWTENPPLKRESSLAHLARVEGEETALALRLLAIALGNK